MSASVTPAVSRTEGSMSRGSAASSSSSGLPSRPTAASDTSACVTT